MGASRNGEAWPRDRVGRKASRGGHAGNEEQYHAILQQVSDCIALIDIETKRYLESNRAFQVLVGYSEEELSRMTLYDIVVRAGSEIDESVRRIVDEEGTYYVGERQYRRKNGSLVDVEVAVDVISYGEKRVLCNVIRDITERKTAEKALRDSEDKYRAIFETTGTATIIIEHDTTISLVNAEFEKLSGMQREEVEGKRSWTEFFAPDQVEMMKTYHYRRRVDPSTAPRNYEATFIRPGGERRYVLLTVGMIPGTDRSVASLLDISARKAAEESLKISEEKYRTLIDSTSDAILVLDRQRTIVSCNRAFLDLFGYDRREVEGRSTRILHPSEESYVSFGEKAYALLSDNGSFRCDLDLISKDGAVVPVETVTSSVRARDGEVTHYVSIMRDITERKRLELQLLQSQKMEAIGRLAGGIAHDFNNLLTAIMGNAELALFQSQPTDGVYKRIRNIHETSQRASQLTQQLLTLSRRQRVEPRVLDLNGVVASMKEMFVPLLGEDISFDCTLAEGRASIKADPSQLEQVILNLVVNAREAMPEGGRLAVSTERVLLDDAYCRRNPEAVKGGYMLLRVKDTGKGIPPEMHQHLFEPFYTGKSGGTGLGLSIVYTIVKQCGGHITFSSEVGKGTTFDAYFPLAETGAVVSNDGDGRFTEAMPSGRGVVLVVEDEPGILSLITDVLEGLGYSIVAAESGEEALCKVEVLSGSVDLLITDIVLPGRWGTEVADVLRNAFPALKVLFISGHGDEKVSHMREGENFLQKPFTPLSLAKKVQRVLEL